MHRASALTLALLSGCGPRLGRPDVDWGEARAVPLVQPSTDVRRWYVPVHSDTLGPQVWFVDTGYTYSTCDDGVADGLSLKTAGKVKIRGELGKVPATKARLPDLTLGGHRISGLTCQVRDLGSTSSLDDPPEVPIAGVIGMDVLRRFRVVFDPERGTMELLDPRGLPALPRGGDGVSRLRRAVPFGLRARLSLRVGDDLLWPILDTGATNTYLDGGRIGLTPSYAQDGVTIRGTGGNGAAVRRMVSYDLDQVEVGGVPTGPATLIDRDRPAWEPGLLGLDLLQRFHQVYDWRHGRARLLPARPEPLPQWSEWAAGGPSPDRLHDAP